jgi:hypothetical protein
VVDLNQKREAKSHPATESSAVPEDMARVDPTTPQRRKRQIAPSREAARQ